jgi:hypothetical protein
LLARQPIGILFGPESLDQRRSLGPGMIQRLIRILVH